MSETRAPYGSARMSAQRQKIASVAETMGRAFTVEELTAKVREVDPRIGVATVYRAVAALTTSGWLEKVDVRDGSAVFARCDHDDHHHHVVCTGCGAVAAFDCPLADSAEGAAAAAGFIITRHVIRLYGLCDMCAEEVA